MCLYYLDMDTYQHMVCVHNDHYNMLMIMLCVYVVTQVLQGGIV